MTAGGLISLSSHTGATRPFDVETNLDLGVCGGELPYYFLEFSPVSLVQEGKRLSFDLKLLCLGQRPCCFGLGPS